MRALIRFLTFISAVLFIASCDDKSAERPDSSVNNSSEVCFEGGEVMMGSAQHYPEERPMRNQSVAGFCIDTHEVSVADYAKFVDATGYLTIAETGPSEQEYPNYPESFYQPGSALFSFSAKTNSGQWQFSRNANWKDPKGNKTSELNAQMMPVRHLALKDARAYAEWLGRRLPTEAEWEFAAKQGGLIIDLDAQVPMANIWDGVFPHNNTGRDGFTEVAPVASFEPDSNGIYDMLGNVWEWTDDNYDTSDELNHRVKRYVIKGGSYLCATNYCARFRSEARQPQEVGLGASYIGFRTVRDVETGAK